MYKPNFKRLDELTELGFLRKIFSPCGKLFLYNYTDKCTYEKKWTKHTLNARGTVYEVGTNKVIAMAFPKFFNFGELAVSLQRNLINKTDFEVFEKADGSLGIVYFYDGTWRVNTRGSFTSDQAIKATEMLSKYDFGPDGASKTTTYLVEIIYPENRIIVDYGKEEKLVLLASFQDGKEKPVCSYMRDTTELPSTPKYNDFRSIQEVIDEQARLGKMEEGFVIRFKDGLRVKFKSAEYLKVARILSNMTPLMYWKNMKGGFVDRDLLTEIPEEFEEESNKIKNDLLNAFIKTRNEIIEDFNYVMKSIGGLDSEDDRKNLGLFLKENPNEIKHSSAMFPMLLKSGTEKYIMKVIRPKNNMVL